MWHIMGKCEGILEKTDLPIANDQRNLVFVALVIDSEIGGYRC